VRRKYSVYAERADKLFKCLSAARLDHTHEQEMSKLNRVQLLIIDDLALHPLAPTRPTTFMS
jgi:DNA replication protein DnaC